MTNQIEFIKIISIIVLLNKDTVLTIKGKEPLRIIGGYYDTEIQYPWAIGISQKFNDTMYLLCTGSLITSEWVLTAAHCIGTHIRINTNKQIFESDFSEILKKYLHPNYIYHDSLSLATPINDLALYRVVPTEVKAYVKISALDYKSLIGKEVYVLGYGLNTTLSRRETSTSRLKYGKGLVNKCEGTDSFNKNPVMCIVRQCKEGALATKGDSGGAVIHDGKIVGINSYAFGTSRWWNISDYTDPMSVYATPVSPYLEWIIKTVNLTKDSNL